MAGIRAAHTSSEYYAGGVLGAVIPHYGGETYKAFQFIWDIQVRFFIRCVTLCAIRLVAICLEKDATYEHEVVRNSYDHLRRHHARLPLPLIVV